jgi:hypothetical protein
MVEQYGLKRSERLDNSLPFLFRDFPGFTALALKRIEDNILTLSSKKRYDMAANLCIKWIPNVRKAFLYFHRYNRFTLGAAISSTFILWSLFVYYYVRFESIAKIWRPSKVFAVLMSIELILGLYQKWPFMHLVYVILPCYLASMLKNLLNLSIENLIMNILEFYRQLNGQHVACFIGMCVLMVGLISSFFIRSVVSIILLFMAPFPYLTLDHSKWSKIWSIFCLALAVFPLCEPVGRNPIPSLTSISPLIASLCIYYYKTRFSFSRSSGLIFNYLIVSNVLTSLTISYSNYLWSTGVGFDFIVLYLAFIVNNTPISKNIFMVFNNASFIDSIFGRYISIRSFRNYRHMGKMMGSHIF